jgi:hypothetical protein
MFPIIKFTTQFNPFKAIAAQLPHEPKLLTIKFLDQTAKHLNRGGYTCKTYGEAFDALQYLHEHNVLTLIAVDNTSLYKIVKGVYENKN